MEIKLNKQVTYEDITEVNYTEAEGMTVTFKLTDGSSLTLFHEEIKELHSFLTNMVIAINKAEEAEKDK